MLAIENVHDLEIALAASEQGSFSGAARVLGITQPAVSQAVARLERQLGTTLFDRQESGHPSFLTDAGAVLLTHAIAALDELNAAVSDLAELEGGRSLCVGLPTLLARAYFPEGLEPLAHAQPGRSIEIVLHNSERLFDELRLHHVDVGLIASVERGLALPHVTFSRVASYPLTLVLRAADKPQGTLSLKALAKGRVPIIAFSGDLSLRQEVAAQLQREGQQLNIVAETDQPEMLWQLVEAGMGVALASSLALTDAPESIVALVPEDAQQLQLNVFAFEDTSRARGPEHQVLVALRQHLFAAVREHTKRKEGMPR